MSENSFAALGVPAPLVAALAAQGIDAPFPIQVDTLPDTLSGRDVLGRGKTGSGKTLAFAIPMVARLGIATVPGVGSLDVWRLTSYGGGLFIPVRDALAGKHGGTYGGGRYLVDSIKGALLQSSATSLVLDFNFAYNPSCAYDPAWACPLAPLGNRVSVEIPVGERYFGSY